MHIHRFKALAAVLLCLASLGSCSTAHKEKAVYKQAKTLPPLEVPPDLTEPVAGEEMGVPTLSGVEAKDGQDQQILLQPENVQVMQAGDMRWLVVEAPPEAIWPKVKRFWEQSGFELRLLEPRLGIMETQWAENRADIKGVIGFIYKYLPGLYSAPTRDLFRTRLERGSEPGTTEVYLTHYGIEAVVREDGFGELEQTIWRNRPSDPELADEMLRRLMLALGIVPEQVKTLVAKAETVAPRAQLAESDGLPVIIVDEGFARAWRRTGIALDRLGLVVEDRDRSSGIYYVRFVDRAGQENEEGKSWFSGWFSGDEEGKERRARITVSGDEFSSRVVLRKEDGARDTSEGARQILEQLSRELH